MAGPAGGSMTNTFGANRFRLDRHGLADQVRAYSVTAKDSRARRRARRCGSQAPWGPPASFPAARKEGVKIAREMLFGARELVQGAYLMPPLGRYELALEVLEGLKR